MQKRYREAAIAYEHIIYTSNNNQEVSIIRIKKANCYKQLADYNEAINELNKIRYFSISDSFQFVARHELALCYYLTERFVDAESQLMQIDHYTKDTLLLPHTYLLRVFVYNRLRKFEKAKHFARLYVENNFTNNDFLRANQELDRLYSKKGLPKYKNPKTAEILKYFPGFGQTYAGYFGEGMLNLGLNLAAFSFGVYQVYYGYYLTGYFTAAILINKFYFGGRARTEYLVNKRNYEEMQDFSKKVKDIILKKPVE